MNNILLILTLIGSLITTGFIGITAMGNDNIIGGCGMGQQGMMYGNQHQGEGCGNHEVCEDNMNEQCDHDDHSDCEASMEDCDAKDIGYCDYQENNTINP